LQAARIHCVSVMESDWKKFHQMVPQLRERYVAEQNSRLARLLSAPDKTETGRFWEVEEEVRKIARTLRECLDGHSRSSMASYMHLMRAAGMLKKEDLADCSEELQKQIFIER
jgi:hypothetical protein